MQQQIQLIYSSTMWTSAFQLFEDQSMEVAQQMVSEIALLSSLFFLCEIGDYVMQRYENIRYSIYQLNWYTLPLDLQRKLPTILAMTEKNIYIRGFARFHCTRTVFSQVLLGFKIGIIVKYILSNIVNILSTSRLYNEHFPHLWCL